MKISTTPVSSRILLFEQTKDELIDEILRLREENAVLRAGEKTVKELLFPPRKKTNKRKKKPGRCCGHEGVTRKKPTHIDFEEHSQLDVCPDCGCSGLSELASTKKEHTQEDIIPAHIEVTKYIRHGYWCPKCKSKKTAPYAQEEIPYGYLGPNILMQTVLLKYHYGLPYSKMVGLFKSFCSLEVTASALAQSLQRISKWLAVEEKVILEALRNSKYLHMDETGWKISGDNHWLWNFVNDKLAIYRIRKSRGRKVPLEVLTKDYGGIAISDFLSAYDKTGAKRQRCLVHLLRDMNKYKELDQSKESQEAYKKLNRIIHDAYRLDKNRNKVEPWVYCRRVNRLKVRLWEFACTGFGNKNWARISKRLLKHNDEIFTFLEEVGISSDNNHAERMIRPNVIFRKISFQNMSEKGAKAHEVLMSLLQTLRLQNQDPQEFFKKAYLKHRQGNLAPILSV